MNIKSIRAFPIDLTRKRKKRPASYKRQNREPAGPLEAPRAPEAPAPSTS